MRTERQRCTVALRRDVSNGCEGIATVTGVRFQYSPAQWSLGVVDEAVLNQSFKTWLQIIEKRS